MARKTTSIERLEQRNRAAQAEVARSAPKIIAPTRDDRARARSTAMSGLLGQQLANISDTLAKASQRRNAEVQRRSPQPLAAPTAPAPGPTEFYLTSDIVAGSSVIGSPSAPSHEPQTKPTLQSPGQYDLDLSKANTIMG
jgi:hypothetical protein